MVSSSNAWLEISGCQDDGPAIVLGSNLIHDVPVLADVLAAAQSYDSGRSRSGTWEYAKKLEVGELKIIQDAVDFTNRIEDLRSVVYSAHVNYSGSCYLLRLFIDKSQ
jgi:hypothetical protein